MVEIAEELLESRVGLFWCGYDIPLAGNFGSTEEFVVSLELPPLHISRSSLLAMWWSI
jgi:hypothetical protein